MVSNDLLALLPQEVGGQGTNYLLLLSVQSPKPGDMGQTAVGFRVLFKTAEVSSVPPLCYPWFSLLFSLSPHWPMFFMTPLSDLGSSSQQGPAPSIQLLSHTAHPHVLPRGCLGAGLATHLLPPPCHARALPCFFCSPCCSISAGHTMSADPATLV